MAKTLVEMTQEILLAQISGKRMNTDEIKAASNEIFQNLKSLQDAELSGEEKDSQEDKDAVSFSDPKKSIKLNKIICLECGQSFNMLSAKHLASHGLDSKSYRQKYGFSARQALCSRSLSEKRAQTGKDLGIPENLQKYLDSKRRIVDGEQQ